MNELRIKPLYTRMINNSLNQEVLLSFLEVFSFFLGEVTKFLINALLIFIKVKNSSTQKSDEGDCSSYNNDTCEASIG